MVKQRTKDNKRSPRHGYCFYCHGKLFNLKGSYRHTSWQKAIECSKLRDTRRLIDEKGYDLFYGEYRQIKNFEKLLDNPEVEKIMTDTTHECWCQNCGNTQGVNHIGSQLCIVCGKRDWMDAYSFRKYREANKDSFQDIGK